ncbi:hypothetical protein KR99_25870, partial [Ralstonia solanacearum]
MNAGIPLETTTLHNQHGRWPQAESVEDLHRNMAAVRARITAACQRAGRDPADVRLLPVSKTKDEPRIRLAYAAGCRQFGENKPREAYRKWEAMADLHALRWSVIGHLLALLSAEAARVRRCFVLLRELRDRLRQDAPGGIALTELSMGMSGDYEIAIEEGATVVRVGQAY